jgi:hypothetical protein
MAAKRVDELLEVLANAHDYVPEAVAAAEAELRKRALSVQQAEQLRAIQQRRAVPREELCPHCLKPVSFGASTVCACCGLDKTVVRFLCPRCTQTLEARRDSSGLEVQCSVCGSGVVVPEETSEALILAPAKTSEEYAKDLKRLKAECLRTGLAESDWKSTLIQLIKLPPAQLVHHLKSMHIECTAARVGARAIQALRPSLRAQVERTSNHNVIVGCILLVGGALVTGLTYARAAQSGGTYLIAYGAIIAGAVQLYIGLRDASTSVQPTVNEAEKPYDGPRCVACAAPITAETMTCPQCGWTQPR